MGPRARRECPRAPSHRPAALLRGLERELVSGDSLTRLGGAHAWGSLIPIPEVDRPAGRDLVGHRLVQVVDLAVHTVSETVGLHAGENGAWEDRGDRRLGLHVGLRRLGTAPGSGIGVDHRPRRPRTFVVLEGPEGDPHGLRLAIGRLVAPELFEPSIRECHVLDIDAQPPSRLISGNGASAALVGERTVAVLRDQDRILAGLNSIFVEVDRDAAHLRGNRVHVIVPGARGEDVVGQEHCDDDGDDGRGEISNPADHSVASSGDCSLS